MNLTTSREDNLGSVLKGLSIVGWVFFTLGTLGFGLILLFLLYILYLFTQSAMISHIKGNSVKISKDQFPDLHDKLVAACSKLEMDIPEAYLMNGDGMMNAFATRFMKKYYVILMSDVIDSFDKHDGPINFYIGHELGHIHRKHLFWDVIFLPIIMFPLVYPSYRRACEYTCDQYGKFCCDNQDDAVYGLNLLVTGTKRWNSMSVPHFTQQVKDSKGFWMSFHELTGSYPWLSKRVAMVSGNEKTVKENKKHFFAYVLGLLCPGFLSGSTFPILLLYLMFIGGMAATPLIIKQFSDTKLMKTLNPQKAAIWVHPISKKSVQIPLPYVSHPKGEKSSNLLQANFATDLDTDYEQFFGEQTEKGMDLKGYMKTLITHYKSSLNEGEVLSEVKYLNEGGVPFGEFTITNSSDKELFFYTTRAWSHDNKIFWYIFSTIKKGDEKTMEHSQNLFRVLIKETK